MRSRYVLATVALWVGLAGAASAIDLTGEWADVRDYPCTLRTSQSVRKSLYSQAGLLIAQTEGLLAINWPSITSPWRGGVFDNGRGVVRGVAHACYEDSSPAVMKILSASTFPVNAKGVSGRMTVEYETVGPNSYFECKRIEFERVDVANPNPGACP